MMSPSNKSYHPQTICFEQNDSIHIFLYISVSIYTVIVQLNFFKGIVDFGDFFLSTYFFKGEH